MLKLNERSRRRGWVHILVRNDEVLGEDRALIPIPEDVGLSFDSLLAPDAGFLPQSG